MSIIQASAKMKIPPGMLKEFKRQVAEYIKQVKEKGIGTLQADWFISSDKTECEIRETYASSESALAHQDHLRELQEIIFKKFGIPYSVAIYGDPSPGFRQCKSRRNGCKNLYLVARALNQNHHYL
jgi:quinol monooxygenase YgiN